jgi:hypothetical protein
MISTNRDVAQDIKLSVSNSTSRAFSILLQQMGRSLMFLTKIDLSWEGNLQIFQKY